MKPEEPTTLSRRAVLRGLGVTMCLPMLESLQTATALAAPAAKGIAAPPVRTAVLYMPNGVLPKLWEPTGVGRAMELSETLKPLAKVRDQLLVFTNLMNKNSIEGDGHYVKVAPFLTGTHITRTTGADLRVGGVSLDQIIAQRVGNMTPLPSLELSIDPPTTYVDQNVGYTAVYGSHISWSTPTTPVSREIDPRAAFDRLFRRKTGVPGRDVGLDGSILDLVSDDARRLQKQIGQADRVKVDEYFEAVRAVEKRIAFDAKRRKNEVMDDPMLRREIESLDGRITSWYKPDVGKRGIDHTEQVRIMMDLMVLGFWTDSTRVSTFMFGNEVSGRNFAFLPGVNNSHHELSHHENNEDKMRQYALINQWHIAQYAYLLERMQGIKEANGTLLDNSMILFGGGMKDGNAHSPFNLPILLAGRGGGTLATGRHIVYEEKTPMCGLYLGMLARAGAPVKAFGDTETELKGLSDAAYAGKV